MEYQVPKGLFDIIPDAKEAFKDISKWQYLEDIIRKLCIDYNFEEFRTPIFEKTELFIRGVGTSSDIVSKEMYTFLDKANRSMTLRPEGTASLMRSFIENNLVEMKKISKFYYMGPMFRYDRQQLGRYRQFHQFGIEVLGPKSYELDFETIDMLLELFNRLELKNLKLILNSIGDAESRKNYKMALIDFLKPHFDDLSQDSKIRFETNPLRILDSKDEKDQKIIKNAPVILDFLTEGAKKHFESLIDLLTKSNIKYIIDPRLVRGLDYYDDTVYEVISEKSSSQNSLGGGGRYNSLLKSLGGPDVAGVGFATGMERIIQTMIEQESYFPKKTGPYILIIPISEEAKEFGTKLCYELRHHKVPVEIDINAKKIQKSLQFANEIHAQNALIIAENEMKMKKAQIKDLVSRDQKEVNFDVLKTYIKDKYYHLKEKV